MKIPWLIFLAYANAYKHKLGISFSPAGLLTPFHLGAADALRFAGFLTADTAVAGSSGGSIAAVFSSLEIDNEVILESCSRVAIDCRDKGTFRTLSSSLLRELNSLVPEEAPEMIENRHGSTIVAYKQIWPSFESVNVQRFKDKDSLIEAISASCTIPFYYSGSPFAVLSDGRRAVDGFFSTTRDRFGCPRTNSDVEIAVCPFDHNLIGLTGVERVISPHLLSPTDWTFSTNELLSLALAPPKDGDGEYMDDAGIGRVYEELFSAGRKSANAFLRANKLYGQIL